VNFESSIVIDHVNAGQRPKKDLEYLKTLKRKTMMRNIFG